jgi:RNA polymerase sigma-70 factor (ECF subfamily)
MSTSAAPIVRQVEPVAPIRDNDAPVVALPDPVTRDWLTRLRSDGAVRDAAVADLHALLLRAARFETSRRRAVHPHLRGDLDDIAQEAAADALLAVLARLDDFRGLSRFTTWAYKFALYQASVKVRKRAWQGRELPVEDDAWSNFSSVALGPAEDAEQSELLRAVRDGIDHALTPHQRRVLVALALNDVPIDILAERLETTRGALYKTLHDARRKLRQNLAAAGHALDSAREEVS